MIMCLMHGIKRRTVQIFPKTEYFENMAWSLV